MCDDFEDDYDEGESMDDEDSFEDNLEEDLEMDEPFAGDSELDDEPDQDDEFTAKDAFILGGAMGWAYERGLRDRKRKKHKRFSDDSD